MKRKIRKKRQIRLQKFRKQKERNKYDNKWWAKVLIGMFDNHPYWITASLSFMPLSMLICIMDGNLGILSN